MAQSIQISSFYHFSQLNEPQVEELRSKLLRFASNKDLKGLFIIGSEGCNSTFSGPIDVLDELKKELFSWLNTEDLFFKDSYHDKHPFNEFKVKVRDEIVTIGKPEHRPLGSGTKSSSTYSENSGVNSNNTSFKNTATNSRAYRHLSPEEWHRAMNDKDTVVLDTRNDYEYEVGHFKGAINPNIKEFTEFPEYLKKSGIQKEQKVLIYCTGGIRCEKAILEMEEQGYSNVFQLNGGILNYLMEKPEGYWEGECFVFDFRVAVDNHLQPSKLYRLCPHCGDPGQLRIACRHCKTEEIVCSRCVEKDEHLETCSKNCAHHSRLGHKFKKIHKESRNRRNPF